MSLAGVLDERVDVAGLPDALLSRGRHHFTTEDAATAAGIKLDRVRPALARLIKKRLVFSPARGLYIAIPPEYRSWGVVPATSFVDALMAHLDRSYYVGYLSAAEAHGAAHQKPQVFQVVVDRDVRDRDIGRVRLRFITNRGVAHLPMVRGNTRTGTMALSTPELTAVDLANRSLRGARLDNVASVLIELADDGKLHDDALAQLVGEFPVAATRRVGWIVEHFTALRLDELAEAASRAIDEPSSLDQNGSRRGKVDRRWRVRVNTTVDPDV